MNNIEKSQLVEQIHSLQTSLKEKYGNFPDSTELLQQDRSMSRVGSKADSPDYLSQFLEPRHVTENIQRQGVAFIECI
jgi:hypothetical protein